MKKLLVLLCVVFGIAVNGVEAKALTQNDYYFTQEVVWASVDAEYRYDEAYKLLELVNEYRVANGVPALETNDTLMKIAMQRALESNILFKHESPYGGSYDRRAAYRVGAISSTLDASFSFNEVQSSGYGTAQSALDGYKNSKSHNDHILVQGDHANAKQYAIGVGFVNSTTIICMFSKETALSAASNTGLSNYSKTEIVPVLKSYVGSDSLNPYEGYHFYSTKEEAEAGANNKPEDSTEETVSEKEAVQATKVSKPTVSKKRSGNNTRLTIKFTKTKKLSGVKYQVRVYKDKKCTKVLKSKKTTKSQWTVKINNKKYKKVYVKVRCYKKVDEKTVYGKWSKVKTVKTR